MKLVRKLVPVDFLDMHGIESWLEDMAAKGLFFTGMGSCFARFRRGRPMPIRYHAEPSGSVPASLAREQVDYSAGRGWHYAGPFGQAFAVYWADDPETEEFHTDPVAQSYALEHLSRRLTRSGLVCVLAALVMAALFLWAAADSAFGPVQRLVESNSLYTPLAALLCLAFLLYYLRQVLGIRRLRRQLGEGIPAPTGRGWKRTGLIRQLYTLLMTLAAVASIASGVYFFTAGRWASELAGLARPAPLLSLAELEGVATYLPEPFSYPGYEGPDRDNYVRYEWYPLSQHYEVRQRGTIPGAGNACHLRMDWYDLALPFLASPLLDDLFDYHTWKTEYELEHYQVKELTAPGFDRLALVTDADYGGQQLFACAGDRVIYLDYNGTQDLAEHLEQISQLLAWEPGP